MMTSQFRSGNIKDQLYFDKLKQLKAQIESLRKGVHPEFLIGLNSFKNDFQQRLMYNEMLKVVEAERVEREYVNDVGQVALELKEKKLELKETMITDLEEKRRMIEQEYQSTDLTGDHTEPKSLPTRKLRRRGNEPTMPSEKRLRISPPSIQYKLTDSVVEDDLSLLTQGKSPRDQRKPELLNLPEISDCPILSVPLKSPEEVLAPLIIADDNNWTESNKLMIPIKSNSNSAAGSVVLHPRSPSSGSLKSVTSKSSTSTEKANDNSQLLTANLQPPKDQITVVDGRICIDNKWYQKGQVVHVQTIDDHCLAAIQSISSKEMWVKRISDGLRLRLTSAALQKGKVAIRIQSSSQKQ